MKASRQIIITLISFHFFASCTMIDSFRDSYYSDHIGKHSLYYGDFGEINSLYDVSIWIWHNIEFREETGDNWPSPQETVERGWADCKGISLLAINILKTELNLEFDLALMDRDPRTVISGGVVDHAEIFHNNTLYKALYLPNTYEPSVEICYLYKHEDIFE